MNRLQRWRAANPEKYRAQWQRQNSKNKLNYQQHPEKWRNRQLLNDYGITLEEYNKMAVQQRYRCAICRKHRSKQARSLSVDHNHKTGKVRGLLCKSCNVALGEFRDDVRIIRKALNYLTCD